jgi:hypothetical protein
LLVLVANAETGGLVGDPLRAATSDGLSTAVLVVAVAIAATAVVALNLRPDTRARAHIPCPRRLAPAPQLRPDQG